MGFNAGFKGLVQHVMLVLSVTAHFTERTVQWSELDCMPVQIMFYKGYCRMSGSVLIY